MKLDWEVVGEEIVSRCGLYTIKKTLNVYYRTGSLETKKGNGNGNGK